MDLLVLAILFCLPIFLLYKCQISTWPSSSPHNWQPAPVRYQKLAFYLWKISTQYGPVFSLRLGFRQAIVISSAKLEKNRTPFPSSSQVFIRNYSVEIFRMVEKISKLGDVADEDASSKALINVSEIAMTCVHNIIFRVTFRKRFEVDGTAAVNRLDFLLAETQLLSGTIFFSDCSYSFIGNCLDGLTGMHHRLHKHFKDWDLIDDLLSLTKAGYLTLDDVKATIMEIFIGTTDTSKVTIAMAMTLLMKNPEAMKKAQEEVRSVVKDKGVLNAVIKETMRIQPAAQFIPKATIESCVIDGYHIPAKTMVLVNPDKFIPERFVGSNIDMGGQNFEFIPFGSGRRICPGIHMAVPSGMKINDRSQSETFNNG
ncbi:cytochrome P450 83B1 [Citrus sinensis]|uniref:Cytochrome P450 83B1 n=1 Tax=Citrus sinensis TaxID=2711 RepID=A0ACB8M8F6_CITSI|nr:cytochrome P450 83B1 [Citrus sinensis]